MCVTSIISSIIQAYAYTNTINTIFCHHDDIDGIVLPDGTDGLLRTHYGSRDDEIMVRLKNDSALLIMALSPPDATIVCCSQISSIGSCCRGAGEQSGKDRQS